MSEQLNCFVSLSHFVKNSEVVITTHALGNANQLLKKFCVVVIVRIIKINVIQRLEVCKALRLVIGFDKL